MDVRNYIRPILTGLVGLGVVVLLIVLFVKILSGGGSATLRPVNVSRYADTAATATLLIDAPTNIDQDHDQVKITVSQTQNEIDIIQGYQGNIVQSKTYNNNSAAYGAFLESLQLLGFSRGSNLQALSDYRGYCPTGDRYVYTFNNGETQLFQYWSTSCGGQGTFRGNAGSVQQLFERQIPEQDYDTLTGSIATGF